MAFAACASTTVINLKAVFWVCHPARICKLQGESVRARVLLCADGATSKLASHMGYCTEPPRGVCSRAFVEGGTHNTDFDGAPATVWQQFEL